MLSLQSPRRRQPKPLPLCEIRIAWDGGELKTGPNALIMMAFEGGYPIGAPFVDLPSVLSGAPAYLYASDNVALALSLEEIDRLNRRALKPREAKELIALYGQFHEISGAFYDIRSGRSYQGKPEGSGLALAQERVKALIERRELDQSLSMALRAASTRSI